MHAAMILDPWRSGVLGRSFEIGVGARYDIDTYGAPSLRTPKVLHRVAPMTATSLRFRTQSEDGLWLADCRGEVVLTGRASRSGRWLRAGARGSSGSSSP